MEPNDFDPQYDPQNEPQFDSPMDYETDPLGGQEDDIGMGQFDSPPARRFGIGRWLSDRRVLAGLTLLLGIAAGLFYGYIVDPVEWFDMGIEHLRADLQEDYVRMVIDSYDSNEDQDLALRRLNRLGGDRSVEILISISSNPGTQDIGRVQQLSALVNQGVGGGLAPDMGALTSPEAGAGGQAAGGGSTFLMACTVLFVLGVVVIGVIYIRRRTRGGDPTTVMQAQEITRQAPQTDYVALGESQPISQWMTTYLIGDDLFDDSYSIDNPAGEFMGECGVGIADTIGVGEPKRVSAFEIWLFDKNDIQTVTKVLLSEHAFSDDAIQDRLSAKGDPEMSLPGHEVILETETLQMVARVVDMAYGAGALPDNSFFERMTIELAVWQKK